MSGVAVVTDSTADFDLEQAEDLGLRVVPMTVAVDDESFLSRLTITDEQFYARLESSATLPTTSQPAPAWFDEAYADAADAGADGIVSIHLSAALSGTVEAAQSRASPAPLPVRVVDTRQVAGGLALSVLGARAAANAGGDLEDVTAAACRVAERARTFFVVDTLEYLRRGGRLSGTQAMVGNMLRVKPILTLVDGRVEVVDRARTWSRALERVGQLVAEAAGGRPVDLVVSHALAPDRAAGLGALVEERVTVRSRTDTRVGPVVGTHCGPGSVGLAVAPAES